MKSLLALVGCVALCACQTVRERGTPETGISLPSLYSSSERRAARGARQNERTRLGDEGADNPCLVDINTRAEDIVVHGTFIELCQLSWFAENEASRALIPRQTPTETQAPQRQRNAPANAPEPARGSETSLATQWRTAAADARSRYLRSGIALSDQLCDAYFNRFGVRDVTLSASGTALSDFNAASTTIMAATDTPQRAIAVASSVVDLFSASVRNGRQNFAFNGNIQAVYTLVRATRQNFVGTLAANAPTDFWSTYRWLNSYHQSCSFTSVRLMVDAAISQRAGEAVDVSDGVTFNQTLSEDQRRLLSERLGLKSTLSENQIVLAVAISQFATREQRAVPAFAQRLAEQLELVSGAKPRFDVLFDSAGTRTALTSYINALGPDYSVSYNYRARSLIAELAPALAPQPAREQPPTRQGDPIEALAPTAVPTTPTEPAPAPVEPVVEQPSQPTP